MTRRRTQPNPLAWLWGEHLHRQYERDRQRRLQALRSGQVHPPSLRTGQHMHAIDVTGADLDVPTLVRKRRLAETMAFPALTRLPRGRKALPPPMDTPPANEGALPFLTGMGLSKREALRALGTVPAGLSLEDTVAAAFQAHRQRTQGNPGFPVAAVADALADRWGTTPATIPASGWITPYGDLVPVTHARQHAAAAKAALATAGLTVDAPQALTTLQEQQFARLVVVPDAELGVEVTGRPTSGVLSTLRAVQARQRQVPFYYEVHAPGTGALTAAGQGWDAFLQAVGARHANPSGVPWLLLAAAAVLAYGAWEQGRRRP